MDPSREEQSKFDSQRMHERLTIDKADNGYVVKAWPKMLIFGTLEELFVFMKTHYAKPVTKKGQS